MKKAFSSEYLWLKIHPSLVTSYSSSLSGVKKLSFSYFFKLKFSSLLLLFLFEASSFDP